MLMKNQIHSHAATRMNCKHSIDRKKPGTKVYVLHKCHFYKVQNPGISKRQNNDYLGEEGGSSC